MKSNKFVLALGTAGLLGISYLGATVYINHRLDLIEIPVASHLLSPRTLIDEDDVKMIKIPKGMLQSSIILDPHQMIGKYTLINTQIPQGSFIYNSMIEEAQHAKDYPSLLLHPDQVVYALEVDLKMTSGNTLQPAQKVAIYVSLTHERITIVDQLISNVRILSIKDKNGKDIDKATDIPKIMLIALDQRLVILLTKAIELGDLILTPVSIQDNGLESVLIDNTALLDVLYER